MNFKLRYEQQTHVRTERNVPVAVAEQSEAWRVLSLESYRYEAVIAGSNPAPGMVV
jgi:hypothetical protein